jgi:hypothetical protein
LVSKLSTIDLQNVFGYGVWWQQCKDPVPGSTACPGRFFRGLFARLCGFVSVSIWLIHLRGRVLRDSRYWEVYEKNKGPQKMTKTHRDYSKLYADTAFVGNEF